MDGKFFTALMLCLAMICAARMGFAEQSAQHLVKGESATIQTAYDIGDAAMTDPRVCDFLVRDNRREVYLNARAPGTVMLTLWDLDGAQRDVIPIQVSAVNAAQFEQGLRSSLGLSESVRFVQRGDRIVLEGEVGSEEDLHRIEAATADQPHVESQLRIGATALRKLAEEIEAAVGRPGITVRQVKDRLVLEGIAYSAEAARHAEQIAQIYHRNILNLLEIRETHRNPGKRPLVYLDVYFVELKKNALRGFGVQWYPGAVRKRNDGGLGGIVSSTLGFVFDLLPKIRWARERGEGRILEHPQMVVKSGEEASFFSGVEIPYTTDQQVQFKNAGITIHAEPIAYGAEVDLKISVDISAPAAGVDGAIDRRSIATTAYCASGQSLVLGGLWGHHDVTSWNRIPQSVDRESALFTLALSKDFQSRQSDFLIFVTPRVAQGPDSAQAAVERWEAMRPDDVPASVAPPPRRARRGSQREWMRAPSSPPSPSPAVPPVALQPEAPRNPEAIIALPPSLRKAP